MMDVINVVFRFLDFFVIIGLAIYGIRYYVIPGVEKMVREYSMYLYNLESDCKDLQLQTQSIYESIQDQDRQFQAMQVKFATWQKKCDDIVLAHKIEQQRIDAAMQDRFVMRSDFIKNDVAVQEEFPAIVQAATKTLQSKYHGSDKQKEYIDTLIHIMKEQS